MFYMLMNKKLTFMVSCLLFSVSLIRTYFEIQQYYKYKQRWLLKLHIVYPLLPMVKNIPRTLKLIIYIYSHKTIVLFGKTNNNYLFICHLRGKLKRFSHKIGSFILMVFSTVHSAIYWIMQFPS